MYLLRLWLWLWLCLMGLALTGASQAASPVLLSFDQAQVRYQNNTEWHAVDLPHAWSRESPPWQGMAHYSLRFDLPAPYTSAQEWVVYIPRVGNRYAIWLNGTLVGGSGALDNEAEDHVHIPRYFVLPVVALRPSANQLLLQVHGEKARYAGLSRVWVGPLAEVRPMYLQRSAWHQGGAMVMVGLATVMGVFGMGFGLVMGARVYGLFGVAALLWAIRNTYVLMTVPPIGHPWWPWLLDVLYGLSVVLLSSSVLQILRISSRSWRVSRMVLGLSVVTLPLAYSLSGAWAWRQAFLLSLVLGVTVCTILVLRRWWVRPSVETHVLGSAAVLALALALYDHVAIMWLAEGYTQFALSRFSFLFILLAMSVLLMRRIFRNLNTARRFRRRLKQRLDNTRQQLSVLHEERERDHIHTAELAERMRILRQLHDGVGAHLIAMRSMLNQPRLPAQELENELVQAGLALRDSLQTLQGTPDSWTAALASLRDVMESRLRHAHITLVWDVQEEPLLTPPSPHDYQHLRLLLLEVVTNVIKHAQASKVTLSTRVTPSAAGLCWHICVQDNGRGMPKPHIPGQGSRNLIYRAQALRASLVVHSEGQGTWLTLSWPL